MAKRKVRTHENRGLVISVALLSLLLGLAGCGAGGSSDPTEAYNDLNATVVPHGEKARTQAVIDRSYIIEPEKDVTFIEGESKTFKVRVRIFLAGVTSYDLKLVTDVVGLTMAPSAEPGLFLVSWAAPKGVIPTNQTQLPVSYRLELTNVKASTPATESIFNSIVKTLDAQFVVRRTGQTPQIEKMSGLSKSVELGSQIAFTVDVSDPASYEGFAPRLDVYFQGTNKSVGGYVANGATYVRIDSTPQFAGNGIWRFSFVFDAKNNDVGAQLDVNGNRVDGATELQTQMWMKVYGVSGGVSAEQMIPVAIKYSKPQVANVKPLECPKPVAAKTTAKTAATTAVKK